MTDSSQRAIAAWKQGGSPEAPGFKAATDEFYAKYVWRRPVKADLDSTMAGFGNEQYNYMQGAYEYVVTGTLKDYDARADLPKIKVPVLSTTGEFDEVGPKTVESAREADSGREVRPLQGRRPCHVVGCARREREGRAGIPPERGPAIVRAGSVLKEHVRMGAPDRARRGPSGPGRPPPRTWTGRTRSSASSGAAARRTAS